MAGFSIAISCGMMVLKLSAECMTAISSLAAATASGDCAGAGPADISVRTKQATSERKRLRMRGLLDRTGAAAYTVMPRGGLPKCDIARLVARRPPSHNGSILAHVLVGEPVSDGACAGGKQPSRRPSVSRSVEDRHGRNNSRRPVRMDQARLRGRREVQGDVRGLDRRSRQVLGRAWKAPRLDQAVHQ